MNTHTMSSSQLKKRSLSQKSNGFYDDTPRRSNVISSTDDREKENQPIIDDLASLEISRQLFKGLSSSRVTDDKFGNFKSLKPNNSLGVINICNDEDNMSMGTDKEKDKRLKSPQLFGTRIRDTIRSHSNSKSSPNCQVPTPEYSKNKNDSSKKQKLKTACMNLFPGLRKVNRECQSPGSGSNLMSKDDVESYQGPTIFHESCYKASSLRQIQSCYSQVAKDDREQPDSEGQYPFDLLLQNEALATSIQISKDKFGIVTFDEKHLVEVSTFAITIYDEMNCGISWNVFKNWIEIVEHIERSRTEPEMHWFSLITKLQRNSKNNTSGNEESNQNDELYECNDEIIEVKTANAFHYRKADLVTLPLQIQFSLHLLTFMKDELTKWCELQKNLQQNRGIRSPCSTNNADATILESKSRRNKLRRKNRPSIESDNASITSFDDHFHRSPQESLHKLVHSFASIPNLMKSLLMIDDDVIRRNIFEVDIVRKAMLLKQSIEGAWLGKVVLFIFVNQHFFYNI